MEIDLSAPQRSRSEDTDVIDALDAPATRNAPPAQAGQPPEGSERAPTKGRPTAGRTSSSGKLWLWVLVGVGAAIIAGVLIVFALN